MRWWSTQLETVSSSFSSTEHCCLAVVVHIHGLVWVDMAAQQHQQPSSASSAIATRKGKKQTHKPCQTADCTTSAVGASSYCKKHGGGKRCQHAGCDAGTQNAFCRLHSDPKPPRPVSHVPRQSTLLANTSKLPTDAVQAAIERTFVSFHRRSHMVRTGMERAWLHLRSRFTTLPIVRNKSSSFHNECGDGARRHPT